MKHPPVFLHAQHGAALMVGLVFLVVLTMLGITAIGTSSQEERMTGNYRDVNAGFQAAEAGLVEAERILANRTESGTGYYAAAGTAPDASLPANWTAANAKTSSVSFMAGTQTLIKSSPLFWIEQEEPVKSSASLDPTEPPDVQPFIVSAYNSGGSGNSNTILQSAYRRWITN